MIDSPDPRPFTPLLVGAWWPAPPTQLIAAVTHWLEQSRIKDQERLELRNQRIQLGKTNRGHTAEDMMTRLAIGEQRLMDIAEHCLCKSEANKNVADAVEQLRTNLRGIARSGNDAIQQILSENKPIEITLKDVKEVICQKNDAADAAGFAALDAIANATQTMLDKMGIGGEAKEWLRNHGANFDAPPRHSPLTDEELTKKMSTDGGAGANGYPEGTGLPSTNGHVGGDGGASGQGGTGAGIPESTHGRGADGGQGGTRSGATSTIGGDGGAGGQGRTMAGTTGTTNSPGGDGGVAGTGGQASAGGGGAGVGAVGAGGGGNGRSGVAVNASAGGGGNANSGGAGNSGTARWTTDTSNGGAGGAGVNAGGGGHAGAANRSAEGFPVAPGVSAGGAGNVGVHGGPTAGSPSAVGLGGGSPGSIGEFTSGGGGLGAPGGSGLASTSPLTSMPGLGGSGVPAASSLQGGDPSQGLTSSLPGGPLGPGGPGGPPSPWGHGGMEPSGFGQSSAPQVPPSPPVTPMSGGMLGNLSNLTGSSQEAAPVAATTSAATPAPAAPSVTSGPASVPSAPISAGPAAPSGPLPGYGADLRPAAAAAPASPAAPAGAAAPTSAAPSGNPTTPASGGATVASPGDRPAPGKPTAGAPGQSGASVAGAMGAAATAGSGAGTAAKRLAEQQDLQRKVDSVARQAPNLAWAAGLRDDETTTVLVTDLAGGWIPPTVKLPPGVTLLDPAHRRRDTSAVDLLGAVVATASHQPNTYVTDAGPEDPRPGAGERARFGQHVDELGPTLIDAAGASTGLPRIVQTVARAVARRSGVADNEVELFRQVVRDTATRVLSAYPAHILRDVADWMLLAAIDALIDGSEELARYHLVWHQAVAVRQGGGSP